MSSSSRPWRSTHTNHPKLSIWLVSTLLPGTSFDKHHYTSAFWITISAFGLSLPNRSLKGNPLISKRSVDADNALKIKPVGERVRSTAEDAKYLFCSADDNDSRYDKMDWVSKHATKYFRFLSNWAPHLPITTAVNMVQETPNLQGQSFERFYAGAQYLITADVVIDNPIAMSALNLVNDIHALYGASPPKTHGLYNYMARMVSVRMGVTIDEDFDLLGWAENGLNEINVLKFDQAHRIFLKNAPKK